jgi:predicted DNA-binding transcriptional regulator AlpA
MNGELPSKGVEPILVDAKTAAQLCSVSLRTWRRMESAAEVPDPIRLSGRVVRYRLDELTAWTLASCPPRGEWRKIRNQGSMRRTK